MARQLGACPPRNDGPTATDGQPPGATGQNQTVFVARHEHPQRSHPVAPGHLPSCRVHGGGVWLGVTSMHPPRGPRSPLEALGGTVHGPTVFGQDSIRSVHGRYDTGGGAPHSGGQLRGLCFKSDVPQVPTPGAQIT